MSEEIVRIDNHTEKSGRMIVSNYGTEIELRVGLGEPIILKSSEIEQLRLMLFNTQLKNLN